jgi:hypothetical protein
MKQIDIIRYIVWYATQNDIRLTTNRLVKFIYLIDLYHARLNGGQTLTGFPWRFIHYGPYCREAMQCIDQAVNEGLICKETYDSYFGDDKEYNIFSCKNEKAVKIEESIHIGILGQIQKAIRTLGDDTPQLLDYVYFDTEPMANAQKGDLLDFSKAERLEPIKKVNLKKLSPDVIKLARQKIKQLSDEMNADRERLIKDEQDTEKYKDKAYYQFIEILEGKELGVGLKGTAKIQMT